MTDHRRVLREMAKEYEPPAPGKCRTVAAGYEHVAAKRHAALTAALAALDRFANVDDDAALFRTEPDGRVTVVHCVPERDYLCTGELLISIATEANGRLEAQTRLATDYDEACVAIEQLDANVRALREDRARLRERVGALPTLTRRVLSLALNETWDDAVFVRLDAVLDAIDAGEPPKGET